MSLSTKKELLDKTKIPVTKKEFKILRFFHEKNYLLTCEKILSRVWPNEDAILNRTIDVNITSKRKKLDCTKRISLPD